MAYGVPVIVPPVGGPAEIVNHDVNGFLISAYDTGAISGKIKSLALDADACLALSQQARKRAADFKQQNYDKRILEVTFE